MRLFLLLLCVICSACSSIAPSGDQNSAAVNAEEQFNLGLMYFQGEGVPQDYTEAAKWYRLAAEQGREVFALPGSIHNPLSRGCHKLIRHGAKLVETADDIFTELRPLIGHMQAAAERPAETGEASEPPDDDYSELRKHLSHDPISIDELESQSGLTIDQLSSMLLILELHGEVELLSGGRYALTG